MRRPRSREASCYWRTTAMAAAAAVTEGVFLCVLIVSPSSLEGRAALPPLPLPASRTRSLRSFLRSGLGQLPEAACLPLPPRQAQVAVAPPPLFCERGLRHTVPYSPSAAAATAGSRRQKNGVQKTHTRPSTEICVLPSNSFFFKQPTSNPKHRDILIDNQS
jgi:hypothetical protein